MSFRKYISVASILCLVKLCALCADEKEKTVIKPTEKPKWNVNDFFVIPTTEKPLGIFDKFVKEFLTVLTGEFKTKKLKRFFRVMSEVLHAMDYRYARKLGKTLEKLSRLGSYDIKDDLEDYLRQYNKGGKHIEDFFQAMNDVFTAQQAQQFDDYIYELNNYLNDFKLDMDEETRKLLNDVIVNNILKRSKRDQDELHKKLRRLVKEY